MTVAQTILQQLGGSKFAAMTGAHTLVDRGRGLGFQLPSRRARHGINSVVVSLDPQDTYTMVFYARRGLRVSEAVKRQGVFADQLQPIFTEVTGLDTHL